VRQSDRRDRPQRWPTVDALEDVDERPAVLLELASQAQARRFGPGRPAKLRAE
jgi:hypothetical protein